MFYFYLSQPGEISSSVGSVEKESCTIGLWCLVKQGSVEIFTKGNKDEMRQEREKEIFSEISTGFLIVRTDEAMKDIVVSFVTLRFTAGKQTKQQDRIEVR